MGGSSELPAITHGTRARARRGSDRRGGRKRMEGASGNFPVPWLRVPPNSLSFIVVIQMENGGRESGNFFVNGRLDRRSVTQLLDHFHSLPGGKFDIRKHGIWIS